MRDNFGRGNIARAWAIGGTMLLTGYGYGYGEKPLGACEGGGLIGVVSWGGTIADSSGGRGNDRSDSCGDEGAESVSEPKSMSESSNSSSS